MNVLYAKCKQILISNLGNSRILDRLKFKVQFWSSNLVLSPDWLYNRIFIRAQELTFKTFRSLIPIIWETSLQYSVQKNIKMILAKLLWLSLIVSYASGSKLSQMKLSSYRCGKSKSLAKGSDESKRYEYPWYVLNQIIIYDACK